MALASAGAPKMLSAVPTIASFSPEVQNWKENCVLVGFLSMRRSHLGKTSTDTASIRLACGVFS